MLSELEKRYSQSLKRADAFLQSKKSIVKGTSITNSRELCLLRNDAECPICGLRFSGKNHNTEHIHPRALGGLNNDENKIQMCTACNHDRNLTMQAMLGNPPYFKNYAKIKPDVIEFILWAEVTVDDGLEAGKLFPRPHQLFIEARFANNVPPISQQAYGRFSSWSNDDPPNLRIRGSGKENQQRKEIQSGRKIGLIERFFDKLFGYQPQIIDSTPVLENEMLERDSELQNSTKQNPENDEVDNFSNENLDPNQLANIISRLLGDGKKKTLGKIAQELVVEMRKMGYDVENVTQALKIFGLPRGIKKAIINTMGDEVVLGGTKTSPNISLSNKGKVDEEAPFESVNQQDYPLRSHLNSAVRGLKLPRNPWDLVASLKWFISNSQKFENLTDCDLGLKETGIIPKSRTHNVLVRIVHGLTNDGDYKSITEGNLREDLGCIIDNILNDILERGIKMDYIENKEEFIVELKKYFQSAKDSIN